MTVEQYGDSVNGRAIDFDGSYGPQCWDLSAFYAKQVVGCPDLPTGDGTAAGLFYNFDSQPLLKQYFNKVANNPADLNQLPPQGAIVVYDRSYPGSNNAGHTGIFWKHTGVNKCTIIDQWVGLPAGYHARTYDKMIGWLVPKAVTPPPVPEDPTIPLKATIATQQATIADLQLTLVGKNAEIADLIADNKNLQIVADSLNIENQKLKAQVGNATKWDTLKALIKELIS